MDESAWSNDLPSEENDCGWWWLREGPGDNYPKIVFVIDDDTIPFAIEEVGKHWCIKFTELPPNCQWQRVLPPKP